MKKLFRNLSKKTLLKYLLIILSILLLGVLLMYFSNKKKHTKAKPNNTKEIKRLTDIADIYFDTNKYDSAIYVFNKVKKLCNPEINTIDYVYALSCIAQLQQDQSNYIASEATATEALPYLKKIKNPRYSWIVYNILGINYTNNYDNRNSILYFKKAIKLKSSAWRKRIAINNLVVVYMAQKKYKESITLLEILASKKDISKYKNINNNDHAYVIDNLGYCYYNLGNYEKALKYYYEGLNIRLRPNTQYGLSVSYRHLSSFFAKSNPQLAKAYALKAYKTDLENNFLSGQAGSLDLIIKSSDGNDLKNYSLKYIQIIDSIETIRKKTKNHFSNIKYTFNKEKEENFQLKAQEAENKLQIERQKNRTIISYVIIIFISTLILFLYFYLIAKGEKEKNDAILKSEMRISKKLHDELTHDVFETIAFIKTNDLEKNENKEKFLNKLDTIYFKTRNISKENSNIDTDENYPLAVKEMISGFKTSNINILLNGFDTIRWNEIDKNKKIILYRVLQELFVNMKKHSEASLISVSFKIKDRNMTVIYIDNGLGIKNNILILKNGLQNVESRIKTINGTIIFGNNLQKGFKASFTFPL
ncbi:tetratricopeptide repeat protein [Flavobacterium aquidurense]|uniref:tetratricopeptide repeat-containing sensor histidine kinase n=1 Tax=Flavobacterium aquidurense TaxID=362413 RepID=UPI00285D6468|nr:tetratricopeptide repeat protein [Flavobacterium aquidurense]MDR7373003.1 signal transduction histidine kinase [Flavobacterium aquidurense]